MRPVILIVLTLLLAPLPGAARPAFYWSTTMGTFVEADYLSFEESDFKREPGHTGGNRSHIVGQYDFGSDSGWVLGLGHEYNALDIDTTDNSPPQANGDLHTLHLATQWHTDMGVGQLRLALAPALSVSSNGLKNPDELDSESAQLWGAAIYSQPVNTVRWLAGAAHDYRFGEGRVYPVAGLEWQSGALTLRATYPDLYLSIEPGPRWQLTFSVAPDGNEWLAYDRELENEDEFQREAWQADLRLTFRFGAGLRLGISAGYHWDQEWNFRRQDGTLARLDSEDSTLFGVHLGWHRP